MSPIPLPIQEQAGREGAHKPEKSLLNGKDCEVFWTRWDHAVDQRAVKGPIKHPKRCSTGHPTGLGLLHDDPRAVLNLLFLPSSPSRPRVSTGIFL